MKKYLLVLKKDKGHILGICKDKKVAKNFKKTLQKMLKTKIIIRRGLRAYEN